MKAINTWDMPAVVRAERTWGHTIPPYAEFAFSKAMGHFSILDLGCGFGRFFGYLLEHGDGNYDYQGIDLSEAMILRARELYPEHRDRFVCRDIKARLTSYTSDTVLCNAVFIHLLPQDQIDILNNVFDIQPARFVVDINVAPKTTIKVLPLAGNKYWMHWQDRDKFEAALRGIFAGYQIKWKTFPLRGKRARIVYVVNQ